MNRTERIAAIGLVVFGLGVAWYAYDKLKLGILISPGAGFLPFCVGSVLAALGVAWFVATFVPPPASAPAEPAKGDTEQAPAEGTMLTRFLPGVLLIVAYAWLFERAGFFLSTVAFMVGWQKVVERERWGKTLLVAAVCAGAMYALFSFLLKGVLPAGAWFG